MSLSLVYQEKLAKIKYSSIAQLAERMTVNHDVAGSSPAGGARSLEIRKCFKAFLLHFCQQHNNMNDIYFSAYDNNER